MRIRDKAIQNLGGKCTVCEGIKNLQLHHITYADDSPRWWESGEYWKRAKEAYEHPERFKLLCKECHNKSHEKDELNQMFSKASSKRKQNLKKLWREDEKNPKFIDMPLQCRKCNTFLIACSCDVCKRGNNYCPECKTHPRAKYMRVRAKGKSITS